MHKARPHIVAWARADAQVRYSPRLHSNRTGPLGKLSRVGVGHWPARIEVVMGQAEQISTHAALHIQDEDREARLHKVPEEGTVVLR